YLAMRDGYEQSFRELIRGGIAAGEFREVDPKMVTFAILGIGHTVGRWYRPDGPLTPEQIAAQYVDFILAGLQAGRVGASEAAAPYTAPPARGPAASSWE